MRIEPGQLDQLLHPAIPPNHGKEVIAQGLPASPGAAVGGVCFDADTAADLGGKGEPVVLVRYETTPDDIHGVIVAQGILTAHHFAYDAGAPGIHFYTFNEHAAVLDVLERVDLPRYSTRFENPLAELTYA